MGPGQSAVGNQEKKVQKGWPIRGQTTVDRVVALVFIHLEGQSAGLA